MKLSGILMEAFYQVAKTGNFTRAAAVLHITQSALSQRIKQLEEELGVTLLIRERSGTVLTSEGERMLRYCQLQSTMEEELLRDIRHNKGEAEAGVIRIGAYSSVLRSVVMPSLGELIQSKPGVGFEFYSKEMSQLPAALRANEVDFIFTNQKIEKKDLICELLGEERCVLIESDKPSFNRSSTMLDHDFEDPTTDDFFRFNAGKAFKYQRCYLDEVYGLIDGVRLGFGRAVVSRHLIQGVKGVREVAGFKVMKLPVFLYYHQMPYYTRLQQRVVTEIKNRVKEFL
jgi:DNA-binding transcriptional LysR family regulator